MDIVLWSQILQAAVVVLAFLCLFLFAQERRRSPLPETPTLSAIFSNPYLRVLGILLMLVIVLHPAKPTATTGPAAWLPSLSSIVVLIIGATVAGADFILLLVALLKNNDTFIKEHFALERERTIKALVPVYTSPEITGGARAATPETAAAAETGEEREAEMPVDPFEPLLTQRAIEKMGLEQARSLVPAGREVRVAIVSTGLNPALIHHPALDGRVETTQVQGAFRGRAGDTGTASVGYVAAIARMARIFSVSVFDESYITRDTQIIEGVQAALQWEPDVVLFDFGGSAPIKGLGQAIKRFADSVLFVAPAGNERDDRPIWPAAEDGVLAVAATTSRGKLAAFSSFGRGVHFAAPGVEVVSLADARDGQLVFHSLSGTSMAAGLVTAVATLALAAKSEVRPQALVELLKATGRPVSGHRSICLIDAAGLLLRLTG